MPSPVIELPSKVTVAVSGKTFMVTYGYSGARHYFDNLDLACQDIVDYFIKRKVTSCFTDLKSIIAAVKDAQAQVTKELVFANIKRLEQMALQVEHLKDALKREHHYRVKASKPPDTHEKDIESLLGK